MHTVDLNRLLVDLSRNAELDRLLALMDPSPSAPPAQPKARLGYYARRVRLGVWSCRRGDPDLYRRLREWKVDPAGQEAFADWIAAELASLMRYWQPILPRDWLVTVTPQGASAPGPYPAGFLGRRVAERLDRDFQTFIDRTDTKRYHGRHYTLGQAPFTLRSTPRAPVLVG